MEAAGGGGFVGYHVAYTPPITKGPSSPSSFSTSVANGLSSASYTAQGHYNSTGSLQSSDYTALATSAQTFFSEMDSTGATATIQSWILSNQELFTTNPTEAQLEAAFTALNASGSALVVPESTFINYILNVPLADRQEFLSYVEADGLDYIHSQVVAELNTLAGEAMNMRHGGAVMLAGCHVPWATIAGFYIGIAALAVTGPVGWAMGAASIAIGMGGAIGGC